MSLFDRIKSVVDVADDVVSGASLLSDTAAGVKFDFVKAVLAGEDRLLELHDVDAFNDEENELLDEIVLKATELGLRFGARKLKDKFGGDA